MRWTKTEHVKTEQLSDDTTEPSDIESDADSDESNACKTFQSSREPLNNIGKDGSTKLNKPKNCVANKYNNTYNKRGVNPFVCRRSGSSGIGSLLVFQFHAALSDDADLPSRTQTPQYTPNKQTPIHTTSSTNDPVDDKIPEVPSPLDHKKKWRGHKSVSMDCDITTSNNNNISNAVSHLQSASSSLSKDDSASPKLNVSAKSSVSSGNSNPFHYSCESAKTVLTSERKFQSNVTSSSANRDQLTSSNSYRNQKPKPDQNEAVSGVSTNSSHFNVTSPLDDEDPEESEAAQWCSAVQSSTNNNNGDNGQDEKIIHKCALLSLAKLSRLRQITKASYSELILSLLAGALRAYHQTMGFKHPPDLLAFLATEVPVLPSCDFGTSSISITNCNNSSDTPCSTFTRVLSTTQRVRSSNLAIHNISSWRLQKQTQQLQHDSNTVETGLLGNTNRMVAIGSPPTTIRSLCPGRNVLAEFCLPINTEGMLPRLWETKQRLNELNTSVDPLCLAWARTVLYTLMPHSVAKWIESTYGGPAKASVTVTGVEVVSPFTTSSSAKNTDSSCSYQMPKARRLAYMSLLASKSSDARILRQRLRKRLPRGAAVYPPRLGTSFRALARHLVNANAGIIYVAGCPIIRIDTWMPSPNHIPSELVTHPQSTTLQDRTFKHAVVHICRDLSVTFTTYAGQLSLTFSASSKQCIHPNLDLILSAIKSQINKMCQLLSGRHVPNMTSRWLRHSSSVESSVSALSAISMSPSLNPSLVLHNEIASSDGQSNKNISPAKTPSKISSSSQADALILPTKVNISHFETPLEITSQYSDTTSNSLESNPYADKPMYPTSSHDATKSFYAYQAGQPIEQLQAQLRWVQRQLEEASSPKNITESSATSNNMRLAKLRSEFCILLRQLKQRCSQGELGIESSVNDLNEIKDVSGEFKLNCASLPKSGTSTPQKCSPTTSGYPCLAGQFNVNPFKTEQNSAVKRSTTTGDFDEDPDFYITGQQVDDFEDIDPSEQELAFKEVSDEISNNIFTTIHNTNEVGPMTQYNKQSGVIDHNVGDLHTKQKRQRKSKSKSASGRCRPSKIATEVASLNFMPSRRGSLLAHSTVNGYSKKRKRNESTELTSTRRPHTTMKRNALLPKRSNR
ncbi:unnamed protein product [Heterobilharzia americana]|nr:unnamed protein product [Heterobilharzia americana]